MPRFRRRNGYFLPAQRVENLILRQLKDVANHQHGGLRSAAVNGVFRRFLCAFLPLVLGFPNVCARKQLCIHAVHEEDLVQDLNSDHIELKKVEMQIGCPR